MEPRSHQEGIIFSTRIRTMKGSSEGCQQGEMLSFRSLFHLCIGLIQFSCFLYLTFVGLLLFWFINSEEVEAFLIPLLYVQVYASMK